MLLGAVSPVEVWVVLGPVAGLRLLHTTGTRGGQTSRRGNYQSFWHLLNVVYWGLLEFNCRIVNLISNLNVHPPCIKNQINLVLYPMMKSHKSPWNSTGVHVKNNLWNTLGYCIQPQTKLTFFFQSSTACIEIILHFQYFLENLSAGAWFLQPPRF